LRLIASRLSWRCLPRRREFDLGDAVFEIDRQRNQRGAALRGFRFQSPQFALVNQQLFLAQRIVVEDRLFIRIDMAAMQYQLPIFDPRKRFGQLAPPPTKRFDFAAEQRDAAFDFRANEIFMHRPPIGDAWCEILRRAVFHARSILSS